MYVPEVVQRSVYIIFFIFTGEIIVILNVMLLSSHHPSLHVLIPVSPSGLALSRAEPKISESGAERARGLARSLAHRANERAEPRASGGIRSLGSLFCNIHFVSNSIKLRQLYVTEFATDENQFFQPISMN